MYIITPQAISEETIRKLKEENDIHIQKEVIFYLRRICPLIYYVSMFLSYAWFITPQTLSKETIRKLKAENDMHIQKEVIFYLDNLSFVLAIMFHVSVTYTTIHPIISQAIMEETIRKLTEQNDMHMQKEVIYFKLYLNEIFS